MPYKRQDSKYWWISYQDTDGTWRNESAKTTSKGDARALEQQKRADTWRERLAGVKPKRTFEAVMKPYLLHASRAHRSYLSTVDRVKMLKSMFAGRFINDLTGQDIRNYTHQRTLEGAKNSTINRELSALSAAINYCNSELEWHLPNPVLGRRVREPDGRIRWLTRAEVSQLCHAARQQRNGEFLDDFIRVAVNTGCRRGELYGLEWRRVDLHNRLIILESEHTKSQKRRAVPLNRAAFDALLSRQAFRAEHCPDSPYVFCLASGERIKSIRNAFESACKAANIADFTIHDLRHTCAAWLVSSGVPLPEVRDLLGHSTIVMTEKYAHLAPRRVRDAVAMLDLFDDTPGDVVSITQAKGKKADQAG
jgi:integrase